MTYSEHIDGPRLTEIHNGRVWREYPDHYERVDLPPRWTDEPFDDLTLPDAVGDDNGNPTGPTTTAEMLYRMGVHTVGDFLAWMDGAEIAGQSVVGPHGDSMVSCSIIRVRTLVDRLSSQEAERDRAVGRSFTA